MAAWKLLTPGVILCVISSILLAISMSTDQWYVINASLYRKLCPDKYMFDHVYALKDSANKNTERDKVSTKNNEINKPQKSVKPKDDSLQILKLKTNLEKPSMEEPYKVSRSEFFDDSQNSFWPQNVDNKLKPIPIKQGNQNVFIHKRSLNMVQKFDIIKRDNQNGLSNNKNYKKSENSRTEKDEENNQEALNILLKDLKNNLHGFGGRDLSAQRIASSGIRSQNNCGFTEDKNRKNTKTNCTQAPKQRSISAISCTKRQFSTVTGLWKTCYLTERGDLLDAIIDCGNISRCAYIGYDDTTNPTLPAHLTAGETTRVLQDEWKVLNLRRIVTSFLCMALPIQMFGLIVVSCGWKMENGFMQHTGGLVLVMAGIFQLLSLGTSALLYSVELNRSPSDIYALPSLVLHGYGYSTYGAWASTACVMLAGFLCVLASMHKEAPITNGDLPMRATKTECRMEKNGVKTLPARYSNTLLDCQSSYREKPTVNKENLPKLANGRKVLQESKSLNLNGPREYSLTPLLSPVATVRTHTPALRALEEEKLSQMDSDDTDTESKCGVTDSNMNQQDVKTSAMPYDPRSYRFATPSPKHTSPYIPKDLVYRRTPNTQTGNSINARERRFKRSSVSCDAPSPLLSKEYQAVKTQLEERRTRSLPRNAGNRRPPLTSRSTLELDRISRSGIYKPTILLLSQTIDRLQTKESAEERQRRQAELKYAISNQQRNLSYNKLTQHPNTDEVKKMPVSSSFSQSRNKPLQLETQNRVLLQYANQQSSSSRDKNQVLSWCKNSSEVTVDDLFEEKKAVPPVVSESD